MTTIPATMKSIIIKENGDVDKLIYEEVPTPKVSEGSVLVKNHVAGKRGLYKVPLPYTPGTEGAGEVVEVGPDVKDVKVGDRVLYMSGSAYAEYNKVPVAHAVKLSDTVSFEEATASGLQALTAWTMVRDGYRVQAGDTVLVHAAAGGVGLLLVQMCHYLGAKVIGTVSTEEKAKLVRENGGDHTIIYTKEDVVERVNEITNGLGCHAVLDGVGKDTWEASLAATRRFGTLISYGNASGMIPPVSIHCLGPKALKLMRPQLYPYIDTKEEFQRWWNEILVLLEKKAIKAHIHKCYDLKDAYQAHADIESRKTTGKLLLKFK
ncbi:hypothetical protein G6F43_002714 [Rhizopus delemar]|nr:hypothetical protein G6F43_002714 [Rhizopus delemar]